ncbi:alanine--tRNA ligase-related protein [Halobacteria archaeon AArc-m2/3/4]|uniref:Alanine--tRNA ligase-related protein n=1 Tax=Natronoglomus mannanivorans TaxID=2979990 RepID=A0ABT2QDT1_9EURY|nr:alanine--tRNA ligase-related protein [Halobacteria archaeon AArc-m2/3/4]
MSGQRAADEPYTTRFETGVSAVDGRRVWLETTFFYAEGGGQPADCGSIGDVAVEDVQRVDGEHVHVLAEEPRFRAGHRVLCSIDWSYRMYCMRAHTASHVLYGAARRLCASADDGEDTEVGDDTLGYAGFDIGDETVRVDLEAPTTIDDETLVELDRLVNRAVWESRPVSWETVPVAKAREREGIAFNETTEDGAVSSGRVRVVTIGAEDDNDANGSRNPWDVAACGGTHVRNTREIGPVTVLDWSSPADGVTRVEFAVGPRAIERRETEKRATFATKRALGVGIEAVPDAIARLQSETESLRTELTATRRSLLETRLERAKSVDRDGSRWLVTSCSDVPLEFLRAGVREVVESDAVDADVVVVVGHRDDGETAAVIASVGDRSVADIAAEFGVTCDDSGRSERFAQVGGFEVSAAELVDELVGHQ